MQSESLSEMPVGHDEIASRLAEHSSHPPLATPGSLAKLSPAELAQALGAGKPSPLHLEVALAQVLQYALAELGASSARFAVLDGAGRISHLADLALGSDARWHYAEFVPGLAPQGCEAEVAEALSPLIVQGAEGKRQLHLALDAGQEEARSLIAVPLVSQGRARGILSLAHSRPMAFRAQDLARLETLAEEAEAFLGEALTSATASPEQGKKAALYEMAACLGRTLEVEELKDLAIAGALELVGGAARCAIRLLPKGPMDSSPVVRPDGMGLEVWEELKADYPGYVGLALEGKQALLFHRRSLAGGAESPGLSAILASLVYQGEALGLLVLEGRGGEALLRSDLDLAHQVAEEAGQALGKAIAYQEVLRERAELEVAIAGAQIGVMVLGPDKELVSSNQLAGYLLGWSEAKESRNLCAQVCGYPEVECPLQRAQFLGRKGTYRELRVMRGEVESWSGVTCTPLKDGPHHGPGRTLVDLRDITAPKRAEDIKANFIAEVSHELRGPLSIIQGYSEILSRPELRPKDILPYASAINSEARRLSQLVEDLLDFSRLEVGRFKLHYDWVDLGMVAQEVAEFYRQLHPTHTLQVELAASFLPVRADRTRIRQVLSNLVDNATKYSPQGSRVLISLGLASEPLPALEVRVSDEGIGISPEELPYIFGRFYRGRSEVVSHTEGLGLGLSMVKAIVEGHGGQVWVESRPGMGSTFGFTIPFQPQGEQAR